MTNCPLHHSMASVFSWQNKSNLKKIGQQGALWFKPINQNPENDKEKQKKKKISKIIEGLYSISTPYQTVPIKHKTMISFVNQELNLTQKLRKRNCLEIRIKFKQKRKQYRAGIRRLKLASEV